MDVFSSFKECMKNLRINGFVHGQIIIRYLHTSVCLSDSAIASLTARNGLTLYYVLVPT